MAKGSTQLLRNSERGSKSTTEKGSAVPVSSLPYLDIHGDEQSLAVGTSPFSAPWQRYNKPRSSDLVQNP